MSWKIVIEKIPVSIQVTNKNSNQIIQALLFSTKTTKRQRSNIYRVLKDGTGDLRI